MEIVINIPEKIYSYINTQWRDIPKNDSPISIMCNAVIDGTPLPNGHGRLIDADYLREDFKASKKISFAERMDIACIVDHALTIIGADKGTDKSEV